MPDFTALAASPPRDEMRFSTPFPMQVNRGSQRVPNSPRPTATLAAALSPRASVRFVPLVSERATAPGSSNQWHAVRWADDGSPYKTLRNDTDDAAELEAEVALGFDSNVSDVRWFAVGVIYSRCGANDTASIVYDLTDQQNTELGG
jgi:hypothetical protein